MGSKNKLKRFKENDTFENVFQPTREELLEGNFKPKGNWNKNIFNNDIELSEMTHKILTGHNENEVTFTPKNTKELGFFEKFFQLFS